MPQISRRSFVNWSIATIGLGATANLLNACGGSNSQNSGDSDGLSDDIKLVQRFPQVLVPGEVRLPISLATTSGIITATSDFKFPQKLTARIVDLSNDTVITENVSIDLHGKEISIPYYPFRTRIEKPGNYMLVLDGNASDGAAFSVLDPNEVLVPKIGDELAAFDTPTFDDSRGVKPICTRVPEPCPFHKLTLSEAQNLGKPLAYMIGTPAHCATGTCSPALEQLIAVSRSIGDRAIFVHAEVYADEAATVIAKAVTVNSLTFEPVIFFSDSNKKIVERLDSVFDATEITAALTLAGVK